MLTFGMASTDVHTLGQYISELLALSDNTLFLSVLCHTLPRVKSGQPWWLHTPSWCTTLWCHKERSYKTERPSLHNAHVSYLPVQWLKHKLPQKRLGVHTHTHTSRITIRVITMQSSVICRVRLKSCSREMPPCWTTPGMWLSAKLWSKGVTLTRIVPLAVRRVSPATKLRTPLARVANRNSTNSTTH